MCDSLTCLHCGQRVLGAVRWLSTRWRAAKVICLNLQAYPAGHEYPAQSDYPAVDDWEAALSAFASPAGCVRVLRVTCSIDMVSLLDMSPAPWLALNCQRRIGRWAAGFVPVCQNLTVLYLRNVELRELPALPLLVHLILEDLLVQPELIASFQGLASLETLHIRGTTSIHKPRTAWGWDVNACTRLRRVFMSMYIAHVLAIAGVDLCPPPACTASLNFGDSKYVLPWLVRLGRRLGELHFHDHSFDMAATLTHLKYAPGLSELRHLTLVVRSKSNSSLSVAHLLDGLPQSVERLRLDYFDCLPSEQAVIAVPASLRALRVRAVCRHSSQGPTDLLQGTTDLAFGLHAGLERLCLVLWEVHVDLQCLDAGAPTGLQELVVQARAVDMDSHLAAEVALRGRMLESCDVVDESWGSPGLAVPTVQVVHIGQGPVHLEYRYPTGRVWQWPCICGSCAKCLGPEAFGGVVDVASMRGRFIPGVG